MDLCRKFHVDKLNDLYPGHFTPELSLFTFDSGTKTINNEFNDISNDEIKHFATSPIPQNSLQLIRFRARCPTPSPSYTPHEIKMDINCLLSVLDSLQFPILPVIHARQDLRVEVGRHFPKNSKYDEPIFYLCGSRFCAIWVNNLRTSSTRAVLVNFMRPEFEAELRLHDMLKMFVMPDYQNCFSHPMFLALLIVRMVQLDTMQSYTKDAVSLQEIENEFVTVHSACRIETMQRLRDLGRLASRDRYIFTTLRKTLELARRVDENYCRNDNGKQDSPTCKAFFWHVTLLDDVLALDIAFLTSISESVTNQQAAVTGIVNLQDGASMKTIAIITMAFLPATFVATLFAMPMLSWSDTQGHIISRQFWVYWSVEIPLTFTVFLVWLGWWYWRSIRRDYDDKDSLRRDNARGPSQPLEGDHMKRYLKEFYGTVRSPKVGALRDGHVV